MSGLKRRTPLKRSTKPMKRSPLNSVSKNKAKKKRQRYGKRARQQWRAKQAEFCWVCGRAAGCGLKIAVHHIIHRNTTDPRDFDQPCNFFLICWGPVPHCHNDEFHNLPLAEQLAIKRHYDQRHYSRVGVLKIRDERALEYVTASAVDAAEITIFGSAA